jgi:hypothetical protein
MRALAVVVEADLKIIVNLATDSRGCYENARGNDEACYDAVDRIRASFRALDATKGESE